MKILVTGCAGFIGAAVSQYLLEANYEVIGVDNLNNYYPIVFKKARLERLQAYPHFYFHEFDIQNQNYLLEIFSKHLPSQVIHLAAQAGVRYSIDNPKAYVDSNLVGFVNILEACKQNKIKHLVFASSSSVYGNNDKFPYATSDFVDHPISLYAATKKSNELMAHAYSHLFQLPVTGLRYFTVYGPWGRPDMAAYKFVKAINQGEVIKVFNFGNHQRDFTFISDIVEGTISVLKNPPKISEEQSNLQNNFLDKTPYQIYNIGFGQPRELMHFITLLEENLGKKAILEFMPRQPGDVAKTWADISDLQNNLSYRPKVSLEEGIPQFVEWYKEFHKEECVV